MAWRTSAPAGGLGAAALWTACCTIKSQSVTALGAVSWHDVSWQNRAHFVAMAARLMRHVLVDMARRRPKGAGGAGVLIVDLTAAEEVAHDRSRDLVALDDALSQLADRDPRKARIVELRFFGGLNLEEIAEVIGGAPITVSREWEKARAWLHREVTRELPKRELGR